jgi:hypothetical protein
MSTTEYSHPNANIRLGGPGSAKFDPAYPVLFPAALGPATVSQAFRPRHQPSHSSEIIVRILLG